MDTRISIAVRSFKSVGKQIFEEKRRRIFRWPLKKKIVFEDLAWNESVVQNVGLCVDKIVLQYSTETMGLYQKDWNALNDYWLVGWILTSSE